MLTRGLRSRYYIIYAVLVVSIYKVYINRRYEFASEVDISISA